MKQVGLYLKEKKDGTSKQNLPNWPEGVKVSVSVRSRKKRGDSPHLSREEQRSGKRECCATKSGNRQTSRSPSMPARAGKKTIKEERRGAEEDGNKSFHLCFLAEIKEKTRGAGNSDPTAEKMQFST